MTLTGRVLSMIAPVGGVIVGNPYVIENHFVVALTAASAGQSFTGVYKDAVVTLPFYGGTVYRGQHAHWWISDNSVSDYEGRRIGYFMADYTPADSVCEVLLTGEVFDPNFRTCTPLVDGLPDEILITMAGGNGTGSLTIPDWADSFEAEMTTDGNWNNLGTITITCAKPGVTAGEVWTARATGLPPRVAREIHVVAGADQLTIYSTNISGVPVSAGTRITRGLVWRVAKREIP